MKDRIIVIVSGGVVQNIICDKDENIKVVDWDNIKAGDYEDFSMNSLYPIQVGKAAVDVAIKEIEKEVDDLKKEMAEEDDGKETV